MKRKGLILAVLAAIVAAVMGLAACNGKTAPVQYTVTFETNGGSAVAPVTVDEGGSVNLSAPAKTSYTFDGWFDNVNLSGSKLSSPYFPTANVTLYAKWKAASVPDNPDNPDNPDDSDEPKAQYTITFVTLGGSAVAPMTVDEGSALNLPVSSREGYTFIAWCTDILGHDTFTLAQMPDSDITLYAKWEKDERVFESNYLSAKGFTEFTDPRLDILYPDFDGKKLRTKLTSDDVGEMGVTKYDLNTNLSPKSDYLIKWFSSAAFTDLIGTQRSVLRYSDNIFFATINDRNDRILETFLIDIYVRSDFTYTYYDTPYRFHMDYQTEPDRVERVIEDDYPAPTTPDNDYVFKMWTDANGNAFNFNVKAAKSVNLFASYESVDCAVDLDDGAGNATVTYKPFEKFEDITTYDKEDKVFAGFKAGNVLVSSGMGTATTEAKSVSMETVKNLTAQWGDYTDENYFDFVEVKDRYGSLSGYSVSLVSGTVPSKIYVPNRYNGKPVLTVKANGFANENVKELKIPDSVTEIESGAFSGCDNLEKITLPFVGRYADATKDGATHFGYVFGASSYSDNSTAVPAKLKTVVVNGGTIGANAFYGCSGLTSVTIGSGVTSIGYSAFKDCSKLTSVKWNAINCTSAGSYSYPIFSGCTSLTSVEFGDGVKTISAYAFQYCSGLTSITIPDSVTSIGSGAFSGCGGLTSITIPNSVTSIGSGAFYGCSSLTSVTIGSGVKTIGERAFENCSGLTSITIPDSVTSIGASAFENCSGLTSITIPNSVTSIGDYAFQYCSGLTSVTIGSGVASIGYRAFENCSSLTSITIPNAVTSIGNYAFKGCSKLTSVKWTAINCTSAGSSSYPIFSGCASLTSVEFGDGVKTIPAYAFYGRSRLTSITIPDSVTSIGNYAFSDCSGLTSITIGSGVTAIGSDAFYGCRGLTSITIPNSVKTIGDSAFFGCYRLIEVYNLSSLNITAGSNTHGYVATNAKNVYKPTSGASKITTTDGYMFYDDNGSYYLIGYNGTDTKLTLPNDYNGNKYAIYSCAFYNCSSLTSVTIPDSVTSIGYEAFYNCSKLTSITIPNSVTGIGQYAFYNCSKLAIVTIGSGVKTIGSWAFENCSGLTSVTIGSGVTSIGLQVFYNCYKLIEVYNLSSLDIKAGSDTHGYVARYAKNVYTPTSGESKITTADGYIFYNDNDTYYLVGYNGTDTVLTLPNDHNGKNYSIYNYAFYNYRNLTSVTIGSGVTSIGYRAFENCSSLTSITIPNAVTIGYEAFYNCRGLTSVTIGSGVKTIGEYAFNECYSLTSVTIGSGVKSIGVAAFCHCSKLTSITFNGTKAQWSAISKGSNWAFNTSFTLKCTDGTLSKSEAGGNF